MTQYVLIADDDPDLRRFIVRYIHRCFPNEPVLFVHAESCAEAQRIVSDRIRVGDELVCVLTDVSMEVCDAGLQLLTWLRASGIAAPALVMSGSQDAQLPAEQMPDTTFFLKPVDADEIVAWIRPRLRV